MITEPDYTLEQLVWSLARDARDLRERVEFGVKLNETLREEVFRVHGEMTQVLWMTGDRKKEAAE